MESHSFNVEHAILFTQEGATLLQHHYFWHKKNKANNRNFHDGLYWTFNAASAYCDMFPYLSEKQIRTLHHNFIASGLMVEGNYNKTKFDRTKWFALTELGVSCFTNWNASKHFAILQKVKWILQNVNSKSQKVISSLLNGSTIPFVNTDSNTDSNTDKVSGDFQSPVAPTNLPDEKAEFSAWLLSIGCSKLSQTNFFLEKEKSCAKKEKHGEAGYLQALADIEKHLSEKPKYLADKKDFSRVFDNFAKSTELLAAKSNLNRVFSAKFGTGYTSDTKAAETALNGIISKLQIYNGNLKITETIASFFDALAKLPKFDNPTAWKPTFINSDFSEIIAMLKNNKAQPAKGETYRERDERLAKEKEAERQIRQFEQERLKAEKAQIVRFLDGGYPLTPEMLQSAAYRELYGNGETF
jgi:hypothetical protein